MNLLKSIFSIFHVTLHSCSADRAFLTEELCGWGYLVTLLLADICGFKSPEHPSWCDDFAGAWAAETWFSQLLSFHRINVASVCYTRSANVRYGSVRCPMLLFAPWGQTTSVCPPSPLPLSYFHSSSYNQVAVASSDMLDNIYIYITLWLNLLR